MDLFKVNLLQMDFEMRLEQISNSIEEYWVNLLNQRMITSSFTEGIKISEQLR